MTYKKHTGVKVLGWLVILVGACCLIFIVIGYIKLKDHWAILQLKPQVTEYRIKDELFIRERCTQKDVFDFSLAAPRDLKVVWVRMAEAGIGWSLILSSSQDQGQSPAASLILESKGLGGLLQPEGRAKGFHLSYDFEKKINYSSWSPYYLMIKIKMHGKNRVRIDDVTMPGWQGFIGVSKFKGRQLYDGSFYSLTRDKVGGVGVNFKDDGMTSDQAESMLASLAFNPAGSNASLVFEKAKMELQAGDFTSAIIDFMNALYANDKNPEYAYYLAKALAEDPSVVGRKQRLKSAQGFLTYALKLKPDDEMAKALMVVVNEQYQQVAPAK